MAAFYFRKNAGILFITLLFPAHSLFAQNGVYTLSQLIDSAKNYLPVLFQKKAVFNSSRATVIDTRHSFLPGIRFMDQVTTGTDNSVAGTYMPMGIIPSTSSGVNASNNMEAAAGNIAVLYGQYAFIDFGYRRSRIKNAESFADFSDADYQRELYSLKAHISGLFINLLKAEAHLALDKQNTDRYQNIYSVIHALTQSGIKPGSDSSLALAELSKTKISYNQSLGNVTQLQLEAGYLTGIPAGNLAIDTSLTRFASIQPGTFNLKANSASNPLLDYYQKLSNLKKSEEAVIAKSFQPKILLAASAWARGSSIAYSNQYKPLAEGFGYQRYNYIAGIAFQYDLFNGLHKHDRLQVYHLQTEAGEFELLQQKLSLNRDVQQANQAIHTAETNLQELPVQLKAANDTYNQKVAQYKAGLIDLVDLTNAAFVLYRSNNDYVETLGDWLLAQLTKATATGSLDSFIQLIK